MRRLARVGHETHLGVYSTIEVSVVLLLLHNMSKRESFILSPEGPCVGAGDGSSLGGIVGIIEGLGDVGIIVGGSLGALVGTPLGPLEGKGEGSSVGAELGSSLVGAEVGDAVGGEQSQQNGPFGVDSKSGSALDKQLLSVNMLETSTAEVSILEPKAHKS